mmetsp:Transcript_14492/g.23643  ORF Transcript_14492/g.23643 Transcript_14492/m.23643 type:complete len:93 (+) Transcript_14492:1058-1336(+)
MMAQILIDLTDVPAQPPFLRSPNGVGSSKYQGVGFNKVNNTWQPKITIDKKQSYILAVKYEILKKQQLLKTMLVRYESTEQKSNRKDGHHRT